MGPLLIRVERLWADRQVQVGAVGASGELHVPALHILGAVDGQQRTALGAPLGAHVGPGVGEIHPPRLPWADRRVQVPARQPDRTRRLVLQGPDGHRPPTHVQLLNDGSGPVDHAQAAAGVGAQHHHIPDRKAPIPDRQALGTELARLGAEPLADAVELVDLGSAVGIDHRLLPGLMRLPPVVHQGPVAVIAGLERLDAVVLGIGGDRPASPAHGVDAYRRQAEPAPTHHPQEGVPGWAAHQP
jgi:hypothetical protein